MDTKVDNYSTDDVIHVMVGQGVCLAAISNGWSIVDNGVGYGDKFGMA